jgi:hypothetical protein
MTLLQDLIHIPTSVGEADFVMRASGDAALEQYVVTDDLRHNFGEALTLIGHAVNGGRSQGDAAGVARRHPTGAAHPAVPADIGGTYGWGRFIPAERSSPEAVMTCGGGPGQATGPMPPWPPV